MRRQAQRAAWSMALNVAEGLAKPGDACKHHLELALGSVAELIAVLAVIDVPGAGRERHRLRALGRKLRKMAR